MTLPNELGAARYTGNGATSNYDFGFYTQNLDDVRVLVQDLDANVILLVRGVDYTITGERQDAGVVTLIGAYANLTLNWKLAILLWPELNNESVFRNSPTVSRAQLEDAVDRMSQRIIRLANAQDAALRVSEFEAPSAALTLPPVADRAGGVLGFDLSGNPTIYDRTGTWRSGAGAPAGGLGEDGDYYLNTSNGDIYARVAGSWGLIGNLTGPAGAAGAAGAPGAPGAEGPSAEWLSWTIPGALNLERNERILNWQIEEADDYDYADVRVEELPVGADAVFEVVKNDAVVIATLTVVPAGPQHVEVSGISGAVIAGDRLRARIAGVGSITPGAGALVRIKRTAP